MTDSEVRASEHSGGARASAGRKSICCGARSLGRPEWRLQCVLYNLGDGQGVLEAYVMEKLANALSERFVAAGLDRVVPK